MKEIDRDFKNSLKLLVLHGGVLSYAFFLQPT